MKTPYYTDTAQSLLIQYLTSFSKYSSVRSISLSFFAPSLPRLGSSDHTTKLTSSYPNSSNFESTHPYISLFIPTLALSCSCSSPQLVTLNLLSLVLGIASQLLSIYTLTYIHTHTYAPRPIYAYYLRPAFFIRYYRPNSILDSSNPGSWFWLLLPTPRSIGFLKLRDQTPLKPYKCIHKRIHKCMHTSPGS